FCYRIVVTNTGCLPLTNVVMSDSSTPGPNLNLAACFPTPFTLAPGGSPGSSAACILSAVTRCSGTTNVVTVTANAVTTNGTPITLAVADTNSVTVTAAEATAPFISQNPVSARVAVGSSVTFTVTASGYAPLFYQWRLNGFNIPGATASSYYVPAADVSN